MCERPGCCTSFCYHCKQMWHPNQTCDTARQQRSGIIRKTSLSYSQGSASGKSKTWLIVQQLATLVSGVYRWVLFTRNLQSLNLTDTLGHCTRNSWQWVSVWLSGWQRWKPKETFCPFKKVAQCGANQNFILSALMNQSSGNFILLHLNIKSGIWIKGFGSIHEITQYGVIQLIHQKHPWKDSSNLKQKQFKEIW